MLDEYGAILSVEEVMEILGVGKNAAYDLFRKNEISSFRLKNRWKIPKQSVIDYINENIPVACMLPGYLMFNTKLCYNFVVN